MVVPSIYLMTRMGVFSVTQPTNRLVQKLQYLLINSQSLVIRVLATLFRRTDKRSCLVGGFNPSEKY